MRLPRELLWRYASDCRAVTRRYASDCRARPKELAERERLPGAPESTHASTGRALRRRSLQNRLRGRLIRLRWGAQGGARTAPARSRPPTSPPGAHTRARAPGSSRWAAQPLNQHRNHALHALQQHVAHRVGGERAHLARKARERTPQPHPVHIIQNLAQALKRAMPDSAFEATD